MKTIRDFHAHVYFDAHQRDQAVHLRNEVRRLFDVLVGRVHDRPVGPHSKSMFQILVPTTKLAEILQWLLLHRNGLDVLLHADTGNDFLDHTEHTMWLGRSLPLDLSMLARGDRMTPAHCAAP